MVEGCRRLWVLVKGLPADSAHQRSGTWTRSDELGALTVERQEVWGSLLAHAWGIKPLPELLTITHPDRPADGTPRRRTTNDPEEISRFFAGVGRR